MLEYYKTYYINTKDTGEVVPLEKSGMQYLNFLGSFGWCNPLAALSTIFTEAQLKNIFTGQPAQFSLILDKAVIGKRKVKDPYNSYDTVDLIIGEFREPTAGLILSIYLISQVSEKKYLSHDWYHDFPIDDRLNGWTSWPLHTKTAWAFKKKWEKNTINPYITFHKTEPLSFQSANDYNKNGDKLIHTILDSFNIEYKLIDYTIPPEKVFELLLGTSLHISYVGGTWWLANYMRVPLLDYGNLSKVPGSLFGLLTAPPGRPMPQGGTIQPQIMYQDGKFKEVNIKPTDTLGYIEDTDEDLYRIANKILENLDD